MIELPTPTSDIGLAIVVIYLVVKEMIGLLKKKSSGMYSDRKIVTEMQDWQQKHSMEKAIGELSENIRYQTKVLEQLIDEQKEFRKIIGYRNGRYKADA